MIRPIMDYAAASWQPWLTSSQFNRLEVVQNKCLRAITGQYSNSHLDTIRLESDIPSYATHSKRLIAAAFEKGLRCPDNHPRKEAIDNPTQHKLVRSSFREEALNITKNLSIADAPREPLNLSFIDPTSEPVQSWTIHTNEKLKDNLEDLKCHIDSTGAEITIYTDGSCTDGTKNGGAGAVVTDGPCSAPVTIHTLERKGAVYTCSYQEEKRALMLGLEWLLNTPYQSVSFCTDSLSLLQAIQNYSDHTAEIRQLLARACTEAHLHYVPGHKGIPGNERADQHAKNAAKLPVLPITSVPLMAAKNIIRREISDPPTQHHLASMFYHLVDQERDHFKVPTGGHPSSAIAIWTPEGPCQV